MTTLKSTSSGGRARDALSGRPKVAIVTGASSGIGLEMAKRLIEKGYRVVANSRKITSAMTLHSTADVWSGQAARLARELPAAELTKRLAAEALETLRTL